MKETITRGRPLFLHIQREANRSWILKNLLNSVPDRDEGKTKEDSESATDLGKKGGAWEDQHLKVVLFIFNEKILGTALSLYLALHLSLHPSVIWNSPQGEGVVLRLKAGRLSLSDKVVLGVLARLRASSPFSYVFRLQGSNLLIQSFKSSEQNIWEHYKSNHLNCSNVEHRGNSLLLHRSHLVLHPALAEMVCLTHDWKL